MGEKSVCLLLRIRREKTPNEQFLHMWVMPLTGVLAPDLILFYFVSFTPSCLPSPFYSSTAALLVVCCMLHRCFPYAIIRLFFKWLLGTDVLVCALSFPWLKALCTESRLHCCYPFDLKSEGEKKSHTNDAGFRFRLLGNGAPGCVSPASFLPHH